MSTTAMALAAQLAGAVSPFAVFADITGASIALQGDAAGAFAAASDDAEVFVSANQFTAGLAQILANDDATATANAACYRKGTRILTMRGPVAIEALAIGDLALTASGAARPVRWLGWRRLDTTTHPDPAQVWPFLVAAGAFAPGVPACDLWLSPGHNVVIGQSLVPISALANGRTIRQAPMQAAEYWHVELDAHDIVLAEGLPAESYLDTGNRTAFANGGAFLDLHPDFAPRHWTQTCLPLAFAGDIVRDARMALLARAGALGHALTEDDDLHIIADGKRIDAVPLGKDRRAFVLPACADAIALHTRSFVPAEIDLSSADWRRLGFCLGGLQLDGADIALTDETIFATGWHALERVANGALQRWSEAIGTIPAGTRLVVIKLAGRGYYWQSGEAVRLTGHSGTQQTRKQDLFF